APVFVDQPTGRPAAFDSMHTGHTRARSRPQVGLPGPAIARRRNADRRQQTQSLFQPRRCRADASLAAPWSLAALTSIAEVPHQAQATYRQRDTETGPSRSAHRAPSALATRDSIVEDATLTIVGEFATSPYDRPKMRTRTPGADQDSFYLD